MNASCRAAAASAASACCVNAVCTHAPSRLEALTAFHEGWAEAGAALACLATLTRIDNVVGSIGMVESPGDSPSKCRASLAQMRSHTAQSLHGSGHHLPQGRSVTLVSLQLAVCLAHCRPQVLDRSVPLRQLSLRSGSELDASRVRLNYATTWSGSQID